MKTSSPRIPVTLLSSIELTFLAAQVATTDFLKFGLAENFSFPCQIVWQKADRSALTEQVEGLPAEFEILLFDQAVLVSIIF